jgi:NRAMP (natural resistance-associated macrophage protein)-like metal ion transporter
MPMDALTAAPPGSSAVLDDAHVGDITGALGTIRHDDTHAPRSWRRRLLALLVIMGPGLIVMVGDNDAGGVSTYTQAGQNFGTSLLWTLPLLIPVLIVNQEMVVRLGAVTGVGHARLIFERFGKFWGAFSVGDLFILNFLTIVTEFIGVSLAASYFGLSPDIVVPLAALGLVGMTVTGSFRRWERCMYVFVALNFLAIPLIFMAHPNGGQVLRDTFVPHIAGGVTSDAVLLIVAIVGTTVAPWQLFFQQSNVIDKRITPRWIPYERADTVIGSFVVIVGAGALMITAAFAFKGTGFAGHFTNAGGVAAGLRASVGGVAGDIFAVVLLNASIIGASAVTLATSYACGDVFRIRHSLHRGVGDAKLFYGVFAGLVALAAGIVLIPDAPLGVITTAVQALAGVLLPSATVFLLLLCNDREVLGPWANAPWLNALASMIVAVLLMLSGILVLNTLFPTLDVALLLPWLAGALGAVLLAVLAAMVIAYQRRSEDAGRERRATWRMPALTLLDRPEWSRGSRIGMLALRVYLVVAVLLLIVKAVQLSVAR